MAGREYATMNNVSSPQYSFDWGNQVNEEKYRKLSNKSKKEDANNVPDWLAARYYLRSLNNDVIISCYDQIINSFDNKNQIIETLVKASTTTQIKRIVEILKQAQVKEMEKNNNKIISNYHQTDNKSYFEYLSTESIFNIGEFLDKISIEQFKLTSTANALVAFEIMKSYKMGVFNMCELIVQNDYKFPLDLDVNGKIKTNRVKPFSKYGLLINLYSKRYNIPMQNMLILQSYNYSDWNMYNSLSQAAILNNINLIEERVETNRAFYILNQNKIINLNNSNKLEMMKLNSVSDEINTHSIVLLQYFDRFQQRIQNIQFLWLHPMTSISRFEKYISEELLSIYTKLYPHLSSSWCNKLLYTINKMKQFASGVNESLFNIYFSTKQPMMKDLCYNEYKECKIDTKKANVDEHFDADNCDVFQENEIIYNATLRTKGIPRKFYKLQVLKMKDRDNYYTFFRWGRIGCSGRSQVIEDNKVECVKAFEKKFRDKTANNWVDRDHFLHQKGKYGYSVLDTVSKSSDFKVITFELNENHSFFISQRNEKYAKTLSQPFYENVKEYTSDKQLEFELKLSHPEVFHLKQLLWENVPKTKIILKVTPKTTIYMIQNQISKLCNNVISSSNIAIFEKIKMFDNTRRKYLDWKDMVSNMRLIDSDKQCYFQIVPYNIWSDEKYTMCRVCIYEPPFYTPDNVAHFTFPSTPYFVIYLRMVHDEDESKQECKNDDNDNMVQKTKGKRVRKRKKKLIKLKKKKQFILKVDELMKNMIGVMKNNMYGTKHEHITSKYKQIDAFSFMIMNQNDIKNKKYTCYESGSTYAATINELGFCDVDLYIVQNNKQLSLSCTIENNSKSFPIIARMCRLSEFEFDSVSSNNNDETETNYCSDIGYPKKIWITQKNNTLQQIIDSCLEFDTNRYDFNSCLSKYGNIKIDDNIYEIGNKQTQNELLIQLKPKTTDLSGNFFVGSNKK